MDSRDEARDASTAVAHTRFTSIRWVDEVGSTNRVLLDEAREGADEGLVLVTDHQTAGRGRRGRSWSDPPGGSLLVSVLVRPAVVPDKLGLATIAFGLAAVDACRAQGVEHVGLKWPNDLVTTGARPDRKLAGILTEVEFGPGDKEVAVVIGMGCNVNWHGRPSPVPGGLDGALQPAALDELAGRPIDRTDLLVGVLDAFERWYALVETDKGREQLIAAHQGRSATIGRRVRIESMDGAEVGVAVGLDDGGRLLFVADDAPDDEGPTALLAGDVHHLRPAD